MIDQHHMFAHKMCRSHHNGEKGIKIGGKRIYLAASSYITADALDKIDYLIPLNGNLPKQGTFGSEVRVIYSELRDFGGVPDNWGAFISEVAERLKHGKRILAYCTGSHGRTGCFAASLISYMEPKIKDPIAEIRNRHCKHAVETLAQATAVFDIRGQALPEKYKTEFKKVVYSVQPSFTHFGKGASIVQYGEWKHKFPDTGETRASGTAQEALDLFNQTPSWNRKDDEDSVIDSIYGLGDC